jgi:hypothetical protein
MHTVKLENLTFHPTYLLLENKYGACCDCEYVHQARVSTVQFLLITLFYMYLKTMDPVSLTLRCAA